MSDIETGADGPGSSDRGILPRSIEDELRQSYLDYAMSVIVRRALPDVRDGLKPVHRRVLYSMSELGITFNRPPRKSAFVVGDVIAKYHPHGDSAVYETIVRMAQDFAMRYPLVDGQGNFGSIDRDPAAHQRYTEARMARIAGDLLADLDKETVDTVLNYDETISMPSVLPTRIPNLLVNGSQGIAVGMATNIPPHNLTEVIDACLALLDEPGLSIDDLMGYVSGPDFPTGAIINGRAGIARAYRTGRGRIYVRARASVEGVGSGKESIVITEIPYLVNKAQMIERIAGLVKEKRIEGITEIRDESDREGLRVVIELRRGENGEVVLNNLYAQSQLQTVFGINCVALVDGQPRTVNLRDMLDAFLKHRLEVVVRRSVYLLGRARRRGHILEGQAVALENIDTVVELIRASRTPQDARAALMGRGWQATSIAPLLERTDANACRPDDLGPEFGRRDDGLYYLSEEQAQAILDLRLTRLTALEMGKLLEEYGEVLDEIQELIEILASEGRQKATIREELKDVRERYGDERRTEILSSQLDLTDEDLITEEDVVVTVSHRGYAKTQPIATYQAQRRGGMGRSATGLRDEDFVEHLLVANSHDTLLCFSDTGKVYWLRVFRIPQGTRNAQGRPLVNLLPLAPDERITAILPLPKDLDLSPPTNGVDDESGVEEEAQDDPSHAYVFMATANGTVKKTPVERFSRPRLSGLIALALEPGNTLVGVAIVDADSDVMLVASTGKAVRFRTAAVRAMGRTARGVRGIRLADGHRVIALIVPQRGGAVLTASENGYGKRTAVDEFPVKGRAGQGVIAMQTGGRNGNLVGAVQVFPGDEIMLISDQGVLVRTHADDISLSGRNTKGVRLIRLGGDAKLSGLQRIDESVTSYGGTPPAPPGNASAEPETTH